MLSHLSYRDVCNGIHCHCYYSDDDIDIHICSLYSYLTRWLHKKNTYINKLSNRLLLQFFQDIWGIRNLVLKWLYLVSIPFTWVPKWTLSWWVREGWCCWADQVQWSTLPYRCVRVCVCVCVDFDTIVNGCFLLFCILYFVLSSFRDL